MWIKDILDKNKKILALSPMADMTDSAFCQIVRQIGGADIVFREMVSSEAIVRENEKTLGMTDFVEAERPIVQQIFGADPVTMARSAAIVMEHANPEGIDINMGCPVYKITREEAASPKAKANLLRALIGGTVNERTLYENVFQQVMRLCANCGSCAFECPSNVDIPKLAMEARARYAARFWAPMHDHLVTRVEAAGRSLRKVAPV